MLGPFPEAKQNASFQNDVFHKKLKHINTQRKRLYDQTYTAGERVFSLSAWYSCQVNIVCGPKVNRSPVQPISAGHRWGQAQLRHGAKQPQPARCPLPALWETTASPLLVPLLEKHSRSASPCLHLNSRPLRSPKTRGIWGCLGSLLHRPVPNWS